MVKSKHNPNAETLITDYINNLPVFSKEICLELRAIIHSADKNIIEDWKWGPNFYLDGMLCGFGAFQKHVSFVLFQGVLLHDPDGLLIANPGNIHNRHIKFSNVGEIKASVIKKFLKEAIQNNKKGFKKVNSEKQIETPDEIKKLLSKNKLLKTFESLTYYKRKEMINWYLAAKREETKINRLEKIIQMVATDSFLY